MWGLLLSGVSLLLSERQSVVAIQLAAFDPQEMVWYLANVTSTAIALGTSGSVVALTSPSVKPDCYTTSLVSVVGIVGALFTQRSYTTPI
jgi:ABC-type hemin transport system substrate-binding protein